MPRYRQKAVVVDVYEMTETHPFNVDLWPEWLKAASNKPTSFAGSIHRDGKGFLVINTQEGFMQVSQGDFIIKESDGDIYPLNKKKFHLRFEAVE